MTQRKYISTLLCFEFGHFPNMLREYSKVVFSIRLMYILLLSDDRHRTSSSTSFYRHIIYQNDPMVKPDLMVMVPDLYRRRRRRQARRRHPSLPPEPQGHFGCFVKLVALQAARSPEFPLSCVAGPAMVTGP